MPTTDPFATYDVVVDLDGLVGVVVSDQRDELSEHVVVVTDHGHGPDEFAYDPAELQPLSDDEIADAPECLDELRKIARERVLAASHLCAAPSRGRVCLKPAIALVRTEHRDLYVCPDHRHLGREVQS